MHLVRAMWNALRTAVMEEVWGHLPHRLPDTQDRPTVDSPADLNAKLDAIEARLDARRLKVLEIEAERPKRGRPHG